MNNTSQKGFTLIELLVVILIIATLATTVFVALNPAQRLADARNSRRWNDVNSLLTAVHSYIVDTKGTIPSSIGTTEMQLGNCSSGGNSLCVGAGSSCVDLSTTLNKYLKSMPLDPSVGTAATTGYSIVRDTNNIITIKACASEVGSTITISR